MISKSFLIRCLNKCCDRKYTLEIGVNTNTYAIRHKSYNLAVGTIALIGPTIFTLQPAYCDESWAFELCDPQSFNSKRFDLAVRTCTIHKCIMNARNLYHDHSSIRNYIATLHDFHHTIPTDPTHPIDFYDPSNLSKLDRTLCGYMLSKIRYDPMLRELQKLIRLGKKTYLRKPLPFDGKHFMCQQF